MQGSLPVSLLLTNPLFAGSPLKKYPTNEESSVEKFGVNAKMFGVNDKSSERAQMPLKT